MCTYRSGALDSIMRFSKIVLVLFHTNLSGVEKLLHLKQEFWLANHFHESSVLSDQHHFWANLGYSERVGLLHFGDIWKLCQVKIYMSNFFIYRCFQVFD